MQCQRVTGYHAVLAQMHGKHVETLWFQSGRDDKRVKHLMAMAERDGIAYQVLEKTEFDRLVSVSVHQGIAADCRPMTAMCEHDLFSMLDDLDVSPFLLVLDGVQDPHNLGACMRTALAAGVHAVIIPKDKAVGMTETVVKVASGAAGQLPLVRVTNLARMLSKLKERGIWVYGAAEEGEQTLYQQKLTGAIAWVMGAEGSGLRRLTRDCCDVLCQIPTYADLSSLNVSVATGICLFESQRQRGD
jgi:23S rRNA (guanosine2251-2'-O)-methyltransferase